jgi:hypothetical protein
MFSLYKRKRKAGDVEGVVALKPPDVERDASAMCRFKNGFKVFAPVLQGSNGTAFEWGGVAPLLLKAVKRRLSGRGRHLRFWGALIFAEVCNFNA